MSTEYDFDRPIDRQHTASLKLDARQSVFGREEVIPLWVADMDFAAPPAVQQALKARVAHGVFGYSVFPDTLYEAKINWCSKRFDWAINQKHILMCPGVVPSLVAAITALTQPGDQVIVQSPVYFPFFSAVTETNRTLVLNPLQQAEQGYEIDFEHLESCAKQGAKLLVFCSPHNPVGRVWTLAELKQLLELAARYDLNILSDEIHADLIYPGYQHVPLATLTDKVNVITAIAPTKTFNIAGLALSSLIVPNAHDRRAINKVFESWHISARNPLSIVAYQAAYTHGEAWLDALMRYLEQNLSLVREAVNQAWAPIKFVEPQGTYLVWLDCREMGLNDAELKKFFIEQAGVGLSPGSLFGDNGKGFMRMNIGSPRAILQQAIKQISQAIAQFRSQT